jgi:hypothetical protein
VTSAQLRVAKGRALNSEILGKRRSDYAEVECLFYEVLVESIVEDRVGFAYRNLVVDNADGTVNLSTPSSGRFISRRGERTKLSTPTMDPGRVIAVTLDEIH